MENKYLFKVADWKYPTQFTWHQPILAATYQQALDKLYTNETLVAADLKAIITWGGVYKSGRDIYTPGVFDINL
jgi:hypothetical protein